MHCFKHQEQPAIGICANCGKAVCEQCCREEAPKLACSDTCVQDLFVAEQITDGLRQSFGIGIKPPLPPSVSTYFLFGLILLLTGVYMSFQRGGFDVLTFAIAAAFFVMSGMSYRQYRNRCLSC
jgi:hypothetical protein